MNADTTTLMVNSTVFNSKRHLRGCREEKLVILAATPVFDLTQQQQQQSSASQQSLIIDADVLEVDMAGQEPHQLGEKI